MKYADRQELNELSRQAFGTASKWRKLVDKGFIHGYKDTVKKIVPNELTGRFEEQEFTVNKVVHLRHTLETVKTTMQQILAEREARKVALEAKAAAAEEATATS